jgi:hypothetical protein
MRRMRRRRLRWMRRSYSAHIDDMNSKQHRYSNPNIFIHIIRGRNNYLFMSML